MRVLLFAAALALILPSVQASAVAQTAQSESPARVDEVRKTLSEIGLQLKSTQDDLSRLSGRLSTVTEQLDSRLATTEQGMNQLTSSTDKQIHAIKSNYQELKVLSDKLNETALTLSTAQSNFGGQWLQTLVVILTIIGVVVAVTGTLGGLYINSVVTRNAEAHIRTVFEKEEKSLQAKTDKTAQLYGLVALTIGLMKYAYVNYESYLSDSDFQKLLSGEPCTNEGFTRAVQMATSMADEGLREARRPLFQEAIANGDSQAWRIYVGLLNQWVYHRTIELRSRGIEGGELNPEIVQLLTRAEECVRQSENSRPDNTAWYKLRETAAFAMLMHGSSLTKELGRQLVRTTLLGQNMPSGLQPPPPDWMEGIKSRVYCVPKDDGTYEDRFNLGICDTPWMELPTALRIATSGVT